MNDKQVLEIRGKTEQISVVYHDKEGNTVASLVASTPEAVDDLFFKLHCNQFDIEDAEQSCENCKHYGYQNTVGFMCFRQDGKPISDFYAWQIRDNCDLWAK